MPRWPVIVVSIVVLVFMSLLVIQTGQAVVPANTLFERTWARTDRPVLEGEVSRTWMWAPEAFTGALTEPYAEAPGGERTVQYFDKARMEDNSYRADGPPWDVTNGLLVVELITGRMQIGDDQFESREPAEVNVAGDANDPNGPTYAGFAAVLDASPLPLGSTIIQRISRDGTVSDDSELADQGVTVGSIDDVTNHAIAGPFWNFMNSAGLVYENGQYVQDQLFEPEVFATGRPVSEAYWADVLVAGTERLVLMQCFERRCLTYTPGNPEGFVVEAGNVGQHYYTWRYGELPDDATPTATDPDGSPTPTSTSTTTATATSTATPTATPEPATEYQYVDTITDWQDELSPWQGAATDSSGDVYVIDGNSIHKFDGDGAFLTRWGVNGTEPGQFDTPISIAADGAGRVYVSDHRNHRIQRFNAVGNYETQWGSQGTGNGEFDFTNGIAVDSDGNVYVADIGNHRVQVFTGDGGYLRQWGSEGSGDGQFLLPEDIAIAVFDVPGPIVDLEVELVFVTDADRNDVQVFTTSGSHLETWGSLGSGPGQFDGPDGIDIDSQGNVYIVDSGNDRVQKFEPSYSVMPVQGLVSVSGRFLDQWGGTGSADGQFDRPMGIAVYSADSIYVIDSGNDRVQKFDTLGTFVSSWNQTRTPFRRPYGVDVGNDSLYVVATQNRRIVAFDLNRTLITQWYGWGITGSSSGGDLFNNPYGAVVGPDGSVYVADLGNNQIARYTSEGEWLLDWTGNLDRPTDLAADEDGNVYVVDYGNHRIAKFTADGDLITRWGENGSGQGQFDMPWSITIYGTEVFVSDRGNHRVQVFDLDGNYLREWGMQGSGDGQFESPAGIAVGPTSGSAGGYIYVADTENHRIQKFNRDGEFIAAFGGNGSAQGQFERPFGVALDAAGNVYVADTHNNRVQVFEPVD